MAGLSVARPETLLIFWIALGGVAALGFYAVKGDLLCAILLWFVTLIVLHEEFWRMPVPYLSPRLVLWRCKRPAPSRHPTFMRSYAGKRNEIR